MSDSIAVFLGPSLPVAMARSMLDAQYHPPARMGDIYRVLGNVRAIVLIDGVFHSVPSIWHREILDAISEGVRVYGAASMGALRAAELHLYGMRGVGTVFGWYRDGVIDGDDEVALLHGHADSGYMALSEPLVNIRATLDQAVVDGYLMPEQASALLAHARQTHYTRRCFADVLHCAALRSWPPEVARRLADYVRAQRLDIKRADAIAALRACADNAAPELAPRRIPPSYGVLWQGERAQHSTFQTAAGCVGGADMLQVVASSPRLSAAHLPGIAERTFAYTWGAARGIIGVGGVPRDPTERVSFETWRTEYVARWQREHQIMPNQGWLRANGISAAIYHATLDERALADWLIARFAEGSGRRMIALWANAQGVRSPGGAAGEPAPEWVLERGPGFFGLRWTPDLAVLRELQITGAAAQLAATLCIPEAFS